VAKIELPRCFSRGKKALLPNPLKHVQTIQAKEEIARKGGMKNKGEGGEKLRTTQEIRGLRTKLRTNNLEN